MQPQRENLLVIAMAERCQKIIQEKPEDTRFGLPASLRPNHLRWMCEEIVAHAKEWSTVKSHRWIGFVQAGMIANYMLDLEGAKVMFNELRKNYGDIALDQDLIDHLDPKNKFSLDIGGES